MNVLVAVFIITLAALIGLSAADQQQSNKLGQQQQAVGQPLERQGRSVSGNGGSGNNLSNSNTIEHTSSKLKIEKERREVQEFLTPKNILKNIMKLIFGSEAEISATSRNVLSVLAKVLDVLKNRLGTKSRNGQARTIRDSAEDAANAGVTMLQGYVKSVLAKDDRCVQKYLCEASREATRESKDLGFIIASVGGYASSYLLESNHSRGAGFRALHEASQRGRSANEECQALYPECKESGE